MAHCQRSNFDHANAVTWMSKAAKQGDASSMHDLAVLYGKGYGVKCDINKLIKAAERCVQGNFQNCD